MKKVFLLVTLLVTIIHFGCSDSDSTASATITAPTLTSPADNATGVPLQPTFKWSGGADKLQISTNSNFSTLIHEATVSGTEYSMPNSLGAGTLYFWRAGKTSGGTVYWSTAFRFTTM